ncbi:MAG TPA: hypothetical protein VMV46_05515 [Thermoanaerobaculia bacterium]|nr:hypothetical protein [Thermoanaerobaculia bacterium]
MTWRRLLIGAVATVALTGAAAANEPADRAEDIRPLLIGAAVPAVEVRTLEGEPIDLQKVVLGKRSILLFYRGGW